MKKWLNIAGTIFTYFMMFSAVVMMIFTIVSVSTFNRQDRNIFGYKAFIVLSNSMSKTDFDAGDLILVKTVDPSTLKVGDIIAFTSIDQDSYGEIITHKIREIENQESGFPSFVTYGTTTNTNDSELVSFSNVVGKYQFAIPKIGMFFHFLKTLPGYIICIFIPFTMLILIQAVNSIRLFRQYKKEQLREIQREKKKKQQALEAEMKRLEIEREETRKLLEELKQLQQKMNQQK